MASDEKPGLDGHANITQRNRGGLGGKPQEFRGLGFRVSKVQGLGFRVVLLNGKHRCSLMHGHAPRW